MPIPVSVLIPCKDEELNIKYAIEGAIDWADDVVVLDSGSTDRTLEIARRYPVRLVEHPWEGFAKQWNWALRNIDFKHEWLLMLAADEYAHENLPHAIERAIQQSQYAGFFIRMRYIFLGKWIKHVAGYPQWTLRLFKHRLTHYEEREVHEHPIVDGKVGYLAADIWHHDRKPLWFFLDRHNRYSDLEAKERFNAWYGKSGKRQLKGRLFGTKAERIRFIKERIWRLLPPPLRWATIFLWKYFVRLGFLDGVPGLYFCLHHAIQEFYIDTKLHELRLRERGKL